MNKAFFKGNRKKFVFLLIFFFIYLFGISISFAADNQTYKMQVDIPGFKANSGNVNLLPDYIKAIYIFACSIGGILAVLMIVFAGYKYIFSAGNQKNIEEAKSMIVSSLSGLALLFCSWLLLNTINPKLLELKMPEIGVKTEALEIKIPPGRSGLDICTMKTGEKGIKLNRPIKEEMTRDKSLWEKFGDAVFNFLVLNPEASQQSLEREVCKQYCIASNFCDPNFVVKASDLAAGKLSDKCVKVIGIWPDDKNYECCVCQKSMTLTRDNLISNIYLNYDFDTGIKNQIKDASDDLINLLGCMVGAGESKLKPKEGKISSITDSEPTCFDSRGAFKQQCNSKKGIIKDCCAHTKNSCHYGGTKCTGSYAVDFGNQEKLEKIKKAANKCKADHVFPEGNPVNHIHVSIGITNKCECNEK